MGLTAPRPNDRPSCQGCGLRELCVPVGLDDDTMARLHGLVASRLDVARGDLLYRSGQAFGSLYAVRTGTFKTRLCAKGGREHVAGFQIAGELLGLDGLGAGRHIVDAVALEDSQVCVIPYARLERLAHEFTGLQRRFHRILGREIVRDHGVMFLLAGLRAEERLAAFLLDLVDRLRTRGYSASSLVLRMTREEIGTYLGLKLETVSRCFSKFHGDGLLDVHNRHISILDPEALQAVVAQPLPGRALTGRAAA